MVELYPIQRPDTPGNPVHLALLGNPVIPGSPGYPDCLVIPDSPEGLERLERLVPLENPGCPDCHDCPELPGSLEGQG